MTRAQRRIALAKRNAAAAGLPLAFTPAGALADNPNRGKHHTARMMPTDQDIARMVNQSRRDHSPLTVATPLLTPTGRHSRRGGSPEYSRYTI
jgi:hypothetical protein